MGLVCNNVTRLLLDICAPLFFRHTHAYTCACRQREKSPLPLHPLISFHTLLMGPELSCVSPGWALLDSWGWMRGVMTRAMNCFLFLLKGSSEACSDHRRGSRIASGLKWCCHSKIAYINGAVAGKGEIGKCYYLLLRIPQGEICSLSEKKRQTGGSMRFVGISWYFEVVLPNLLLGFWPLHR